MTTSIDQQRSIHDAHKRKCFTLLHTDENTATIHNIIINNVVID